MYSFELEKLGIDLKGKRGGTHKVKCPQCNSKGFDLSVNIDEGLYKCHKATCNWSGRIKRPFPINPIQKKQYTLPVWTNNTALTEKAVKWFASRGISQKTLLEARITEGVEFMPQKGEKVNTIQFNYFREGKLINTKYRTGDKCFKMVKDAELIFFNLDSIKDQKEIIITEGEMDALSLMEVGFKNVVSVPNGASKGNQQLEYLDNCIDYFEKAEKIILATDQDEAGLMLRDELIRRLGAEVCFKVDFKDCKDANEYLIKHGAIELEATITAAKDILVEGIITVEDLLTDIAELYDNGLKKGATVDLKEFDEHLTWIPGQLTVITGIPNQGKSEFLDFILTKLGIKRGWKFGVFSPENFPISLHVSKLAEKIIGKSFMWGHDKMDIEEVDLAINFINDHFYFIRPKDEDFSLDNILEKAKYLVKKRGINALVIDPWNTLEHQYTTSETQYVSKALAKLTAFKQRYNIHIFLVAHPVKMKKDKVTSKYEVPTLYDISGSANFFNKADNGITVYRDFIDDCTRVFIQKVKFKHLGKQGVCEFKYNITNGRYTPENEIRDNGNWVISEPKPLTNIQSLVSEIPF
jgi:twinkle protein